MMNVLSSAGSPVASFVPWLHAECAPHHDPDAILGAADSPAKGARRFRFARARSKPVARHFHWVVDGPDVATCRVTDDPRESRALFRRLALLLDVYARTHGDPITAIFDGEPFPVVASGVLAFDLRFVDRDERGDALLRAAAASPVPRDTFVATADLSVTTAVRRRGGQVIPSRVFRGWLESLRW